MLDYQADNAEQVVVAKLRDKEDYEWRLRQRLRFKKVNEDEETCPGDKSL